MQFVRQPKGLSMKRCLRNYSYFINAEPCLFIISSIGNEYFKCATSRFTNRDTSIQTFPIIRGFAIDGDYITECTIACSSLITKLYTMAVDYLSEDFICIELGYDEEKKLYGAVVECDEQIKECYNKAVTICCDDFYEKINTVYTVITRDSNYFEECVSVLTDSIIQECEEYAKKRLAEQELFGSAISAMTGSCDDKEPIKLWNKMLAGVTLGNELKQPFTSRYQDIVNPLKELGWTENCLEWKYELSNGVKLDVTGTYDGYELHMYR